MILFSYGQQGGIDNSTIVIFTHMINDEPSVSVAERDDKNDPNDLLYGHYKKVLPDLTADDVRTFVTMVERKILSGEWYGIKTINDDEDPPEQAGVELAVKGNAKWLVEQLQEVIDARLAAAT